MRSMSLSARRLLLAALLAVGVASPKARADVRTEARAEFRLGMRAISDGRIDEGIAHLEKAYEILPHPNVLYNIAIAHMHAGRPDAALYYLERYQETAPPGDAGEVEALAASLRASMKATAQEAEARGGGESAGHEDSDAVAAVERAAVDLRRMADASSSEVLKRYAEDLEAAVRRLRGLETPAGEAADQDALPASLEPEGPASPAVGGAPSIKEAHSDVYEERVVSASRMSQSPLDAPNATAIITAQDIRMSGHNDLAQLLRRVAGVEVNSVTPNHAEISIRGLNRRTSNKVLLLLDGRPVRKEYNGTTWFNLMPIALEDVERIEIIRGPASALYGADAFSGVVNVISKAPGEGRSYVSVAGGNKGYGRAVASIMGREGDVTYRLSGGYFQTYNAVRQVGENRIDVAALSSSPEYASKGLWANGEVRVPVRKKSLVTLGGNMTYGDTIVQGISRLTQVDSSDALHSQVHASWQLPRGFRISSFWDHNTGMAGASAYTPGAIDPIGAWLRQEIADVDVSWSDSVHWLVPHTLTVGGGYRYKYIDWDWIRGTHAQHHFSAYLQDVMQLAAPLRLQIGARVDRHPLLSTPQISPRASLVYRFLENQSVRVSVGRAFRAPTFLESYLELANGSPLRGVTAWGVGNDRLDPESITSFELGYQNQTSNYVALELNAYYNLVKDAILFTDVQRYTLRDFADGVPGDRSQFVPGVDAFPVSALGFTNERSTYRQLGGEAGVRIYPLRGVDIYVNYAIHDTRPLDPDAVDPVRAKEAQTSRHKVNGGMQFRAPFGLELAVDASWFSEQLWVEQVTDAQRGVRFETFAQPSFLMLNARIGMRLMQERLELGLVGTNLTFNERRQHPFGQPMDTRFMGTARLMF
jgi:outer membrane receptor for ferrienterochelin and colicin